MKAKDVLQLFGERHAYDSSYLQKFMRDGAKDIEREDKREAELLRDLADRLDQTHPDGDVSQKDIFRAISGTWIAKDYKRGEIQRALDYLWDQLR